jgi:formate/nitrite transporter
LALVVIAVSRYETTMSLSSTQERPHAEAEPLSVDALVPPAMAHKAEEVGVAKAAQPAVRMFTLGVLAGSFIAFGGVLATLATTGAEETLGYGPSRVLGGLVFSLGLVLVVVGGAELFTGNNLLVMAWAARRVSAKAVLRNWAIVYVGNFAGALGTAWLVQASGQYRNGSGAVGRQALDIAAAKTSLALDEALIRGVLANILVCLAVWLCLSARSVTDKVLAIVFPITAFVAAGFEHSVANMYFVPTGLFIKADAPDAFWAAAGTSPAAYPDLTWGRFLTRNLAPVTVGNVIGGAVLVGLVYAFVYLRTTTTGHVE